LLFSISGTSLGYAGGGHGRAGGAPAPTTYGGGAAGPIATPSNPQSGIANRGGGSGGGDGNSGSPGVVIISYPGSQKAVGGTVSTAGSNTVHTFTGAASFVANAVGFITYSVN
jgi:hypothetical protein